MYADVTAFEKYKHIEPKLKLNNERNNSLWLETLYLKGMVTVSQAKFVTNDKRGFN
jgi:hypothetical protein